MMPETCWEIVKNEHLTVASCWFSLSLHNLLTMHGHRHLNIGNSGLWRHKRRIVALLLLELLSDWLVANRWQRMALAACSTCLTHLTGIITSHPDEWVGYLVAVQSCDSNVDSSCVALWNCGSCFWVIWIVRRISNLHMYVCICRCNIKQPAALHLRRHQLDSFCAVVQLNT